MIYHAKAQKRKDYTEVNQKVTFLEKVTFFIFAIVRFEKLKTKIDEDVIC